MAKYKGEISQASIDRKKKEGRGEKEGFHYLPWLTTQEVPSKGLSHMINGWTTGGRDHHLLSNGELHCFYLFDWSESIIDIREQYPLSLAITQEIAEQMKVPHPVHPQSKHPIVMTTDFLLTVRLGGQITYQAHTFKYTSDLNVTNMRTAEKLEIERLYWQIKGVDWNIITERQLPMNLIQTVGIVHNSRDLNQYNLSQNEIKDITAWLTPRVQRQDKPLRHITSECDTSLGLDPASSLRIAYHLIATRQWRIDMNIPLEPGNILILQN